MNTSGLWKTCFLRLSRQLALRWRCCVEQLKRVVETVIGLNFLPCSLVNEAVKSQDTGILMVYFGKVTCHKTGHCFSIMEKRDYPNVYQMPRVFLCFTLPASRLLVRVSQLYDIGDQLICTTPDQGVLLPSVNPRVDLYSFQSFAFEF